VDISLNQLIQFYLKSTLNLRPVNYTHYFVYPQNGDRIANIDYVTSFHPACTNNSNFSRNCRPIFKIISPPDSQENTLYVPVTTSTPRQRFDVGSIGYVRAIFGWGLDRFCPKNMRQRPKNNSRTSVIKQDETIKKLDYIDCGKSPKNLYLHLHCPFIINIR